MDKLTVTGLVLREIPKGDNDKLLTILTSEHGKMLVTGKGVRSLKNSNMASSHQFCFATYVLTKNRSGYYYISESDLHESFFALRGDLYKIALAAYVCDVADEMSTEENADVELLRLTLNTLYAISSGKRSLEQIKAGFEMRAAAVSGFMPDMSGCAVCGSDDEELYYLDILEGELLCQECVSQAAGREYREYSGEWSRPISVISPNVRDAVRFITSCEIQRFLSFSLADDEMRELSAVSEKYLLHHLGRGFDTLDYYKEYGKLKENEQQRKDNQNS